MNYYDIFFISYNESNQEKNWIRLLQLHPDAKRIHGVKGIDTVHLACNQLAKTDWFWTIDGDNWLLEKLEWADIDDIVDLFMFHAIDPISNNWTKLGGVKLWRKDSFINTDMSKGDFCLNATKEKRSPLKVLSRTDYNASAYEAWKTAFRHCVKLLSSIIGDRPLAVNKQMYLDHWLNCQKLDNGNNNAIWSFYGYVDAKLYVEQYNTLEDLHKINDYDWLKEYFKNLHDRPI